jgi:hypothetical protein
MATLTSEEIYELFEKHNEEHLNFEAIPESDRRHSRRDLCGMLLLAERIPIHGHTDIVTSASHDQIWFAGPKYGEDWPLDEADVIYLLRCGICWDSETCRLYSFV